MAEDITGNETEEIEKTEETGSGKSLSHGSPEGALEAVLFSMGDPVSTGDLASAVGISSKDAEEILRRMQSDRYGGEKSGLSLIELDGSWQLCTRKEYYPQLITLAAHPRKPQLTDTVLETLSIIAYKQPVTKAQIESIRGVSSDHAVNRLLEYGLIKELGRLQVPGRPVIFGTTDEFLRYFGVGSADDLPRLSEVQIEDLKAEAEAEMNTHVDV